MGNAHPNIVPYQAFQTRDGYLILAVGNDAQFKRFCELAGRSDLASDECYRKNSDRVKNREKLIPQLIDIMHSKHSEEWLDQLNAQGIPCGPINNIDQVFANPQVQHRGMQFELQHPVAGKVASVSNPIRFSETAVTYEKAPPLLGQHTEEILSDLLELDPKQIQQLRAESVIG